MEYAKSKLLDRIGKYRPLQRFAHIQGIVRHFFRAGIPKDLPQAGVLQAGIAHLHNRAGQGQGRFCRRIKGGREARIPQGGNRIGNGDGHQAGAAAEGIFAHRLDPVGDHEILQFRAVLEHPVADLGQAAGQGNVRQAPAAVEGLCTDLRHGIGNRNGTQAGTQAKGTHADLRHRIRDGHRGQCLTVVKCVHTNGGDARLDDDLFDIGLGDAPLGNVAGRIPNRSGALDGQGAILCQGVGGVVTALAGGRGGGFRAVV